MTTFTLYKANVYNSAKSGSLAQFDTILHLDGDLQNWDECADYHLPQGWSYIDGKGEDFSYLLTDKNKVIEAQNIMWHSSNKPCAYVNNGKDIEQIFFDKVEG